LRQRTPQKKSVAASRNGSPTAVKQQSGTKRKPATAKGNGAAASTQQKGRKREAKKESKARVQMSKVIGKTEKN